MIEDILAAHFAAYPQMTPQDAVKLLYQHEFGPEHMIADEEKALRTLEKETAALSPAQNEPLYVPIGNGLCRLNLRPCLAKRIPNDFICRLFCDTARRVQGDKHRFEGHLRALSRMAEKDETPFDAAELDLFLILYREKGCPAVHHSDRYRAAYAPAYRVVLQKRLKDALREGR